jgi:hypothetical protein
MKKNKISLAKELIQLYFELTVQHPKVDEWSDDHFKERLPSLYRFQRIGSILKSFDCSIHSFIQGDFIQVESDEINMKIHQLLEAEFPKIHSERISAEQLNISEMIFIFNRLLNYRKEMSNLLDINSDVFAASDNYRLPLQLVYSINKKIAKKAKIIDRILILFLEPKLAKIDRHILISKFNYPDVNLMEIDIDFM